MKIGIFGGSFDPVHNEHIALVRSAVKTFGLDKVFVVPAGVPPHKIGKTLAPNQARLDMCALAFSSVKEVEISDYEIKKQGASYTYLTCEYFRSLYPTAEIFWLVGTDMLRDFYTWKYPERILRAVKLAVCARAETGAWQREELARFWARFGVGFEIISYEGLPVSSTEIRVLAGAGMRLNGFVDEKTEEYIFQNRLYEIKNAPKALALETEKRRAHSLRVAKLAATRSAWVGVPEDKAITASLFHDCAKNLSPENSVFKGFSLKKEWGNVPSAVWHQFAGAYLAEEKFGVKDSGILDAIRFHTSGKEEMSELGKLVFLADMLEEERRYEGVEKLRALFFGAEKTGAGAFDKCLAVALDETVKFLQKKGEEIYPLTLKANEFYKEKR